MDGDDREINADSEIQRTKVRIEKGIERLTSGGIGLSIDDGKTSDFFPVPY